MPLARIYALCQCGCKEFERVGSVPITSKRYTDKIVKYRCKNCGNIITVGEKDNDKKPEEKPL
jgi:hypothetical protein